MAVVKRTERNIGIQMLVASGRATPNSSRVHTIADWLSRLMTLSALDQSAAGVRPPAHGDNIIYYGVYRSVLRFRQQIVNVFLQYHRWCFRQLMTPAHGGYWSAVTARQWSLKLYVISGSIYLKLIDRTKFK